MRSRLEARLLHITTALLTLTGVVYACLHYLLKPVDPFSVVNHPLEPYMMWLHIVIAPVLILLIGVILHSHILFKLGAGARAKRRSGTYLIPIFLVMVLSGYLLQVFTGAGHKLMFWMHLSSGLAWASLYMTHQIISLKFRRAMRKRFSTVLSLFASSGTLIRRALPALFVSFGFGAAFASFVSTFPWLVGLSHHKTSVFTIGGILLGFTSFMLYGHRANGMTQCEKGMGACEHFGKFSRVLLWLSIGIYLVGFFMAYLYLPILLYVEAR